MFSETMLVQLIRYILNLDVVVFFGLVFFYVNPAGLVYILKYFVSLPIKLGNC